MKKLVYSAFTALILIVFCASGTAQWTEQTSGVTTALYSVDARDSTGNVVWACGASGKILKTTNGGLNWTVYTLPPNPTLSLYNICGVNDTLCLVTGSGSTATYVYRTINGGANWTEVFNQTGGFINNIGFFIFQGINRIIIGGDPVGGRWTFFSSDNFGTTWDSTAPTLYLPQSGTEAGWNNSACGFGDPYYDTWTGTNNTRVYKYDEGFYTQTTPGLTNSYSMWANDINNIMVGGTIMLFSTNSGDNWTDVNAIGTGDILGIGGYGTKWWYVRGSSVYYSANNGTNWSMDYTSTGTYYDLAIAKNGSIWAVKSNGGISKYTPSVGINPISNEIPMKYAVYQNYPNPFNPATKIRFDIPENAYVSITVFNSLGQEIAALVNRNLNAGTYETEWDASEYSSGVYFYKINTENYTETKSMMLVK